MMDGESKLDKLPHLLKRPLSRGYYALPVITAFVVFGVGIAHLVKLIMYESPTHEKHGAFILYMTMDGLVILAGFCALVYLLPSCYYNKIGIVGMPKRWSLFFYTDHGIMSAEEEVAAWVWHWIRHSESQIERLGIFSAAGEEARCMVTLDPRELDRGRVMRDLVQRAMDRPDILISEIEVGDERLIVRLTVPPRGHGQPLVFAERDDRPNK